MFKDIFKQLIQNSNITVYQISKDTGISESLMSQWKSGRQLPKYDSLNVLADYFNVSGDYLLGRTDKSNIVEKSIANDTTVKVKNKIIPFYLTGASAGTGNWLSDDVTFQYMTVPQNDKTANADLMIKVTGDSMQPRFFNDDVLLIKKTPAIVVGEIGIFIVNGDSYVKKMGIGELVSLNPEYDNIKLNEFDDISCIGKVIDTIILDNYT